MAIAPVWAHIELGNLTKKYGKERLEAACQRAQTIGGMHYKSIESILRKSLDKLPLDNDEEPTQTALPLNHDNLRGPGYYH